MPIRFVRALNRREKERIRERAAAVLAAHPEVLFAYLHGSFLRDGPFHDFDVAVFLAPGAVANDRLRGYECDLASELEGQVKIPVDIRILNDAPVTFRYHALKGSSLVVRDGDLMDEFLARTWDEYLDFAPFARRYLREVLSE